MAGDDMISKIIKPIAGNDLTELVPETPIEERVLEKSANNGEIEISGAFGDVQGLSALQVADILGYE